MSDSQDIRRALEKTLNGVSGLPAIAWENTKFNPVSSDEWLRARLNINEILPSTVGVGNDVRWSGLFTIDCFVKQNTATADADDLADSILGAFAYGTQITENGKTINVRFSERAGGIQDAPWYFVPVTITWYAFIGG